MIHADLCVLFRVSFCFLRLVSAHVITPSRGHHGINLQQPATTPTSYTPYLYPYPYPVPLTLTPNPYPVPVPVPVPLPLPMTR